MRNIKCKQIMQYFLCIIPSDTMHPTKFTTTKNYKYNMGPQKKKNTSLNQHGSSVTHPSNKHNLQKQRESENKTNYIPTIVNGLTNVTPTSETKLEDNVPTRNLLNELRETINSYNKEVGTVSKKHKVILIGDSNIRGYVYNLKPLLNNSYELYSVIKPGASTNELKDSAKEEISQLSYDDVIVICYGTNDYEVNNFSLTLQNIVNFLTNSNQTNIILMNLP